MALSFGSLAASSFGQLNGYWGQIGSDRLKYQCDLGIPYITLAFVNNSPEADPKTGYPGTNFAGHCWAGVYSNNGYDSKLLSECVYIQQDIPYCQEKGVKIILSIGGDPNYGDYELTSIETGQSFADFLWNAFGPYNSNWTGPRPFDISATEHVSVDGFDFDIETSYNSLKNKPYVAMAERLRKHDPSIIITGAPECPIATNHMTDMIQDFRFDWLNIQFYNNPVCDGIVGNTPGDKFNYDEWEKALAKGASKSAKIFMTFPAAQDAAGSGFIKAGAIKDYICTYGSRKSFGGVSLWDLSFGSQNTYKNLPFQSYVLLGLQYGCAATPTGPITTVTSTTSSTLTTAKTITSSELSTTSTTTKAITSSTSTRPVTTSTTTKATTFPTSTKPTTIKTSSKATSSTSTKPVTMSTSTKDTTTLTSSEPVTSETSTKLSITSASSSIAITWNSTTATTASVTTGGPITSTATSSFEFTSSSMQHITSSTSVTSTAGSSASQETTSSTVISHSSTTRSSATGTSSTITKAWLNSTTTSASWTTSTHFTTSVHTITKCPPSVTDCPVGHVITETVALYTTVCPVTATEPSRTPLPTTTKVKGVPSTTSTVYSTRTYTITSCAPEVTDCPAGKVTTEIVAWYTTICPVTQTRSVNDKSGGPGSSETLKMVETFTSTAAIPSLYTTIPVAAPTIVGTSTQPDAGIPPLLSSEVESNPGVAVPTNSLTHASTSTSTTEAPTMPVTAGAARLDIGVYSLAVIVLAQIVAL